jgi:hypothetical protein
MAETPIQTSIHQEEVIQDLKQQFHGLAMAMQQAQQLGINVHVQVICSLRDTDSEIDRMGLIATIGGTKMLEIDLREDMYSAADFAGLLKTQKNEQ